MDRASVAFVGGATGSLAVCAFRFGATGLGESRERPNRFACRAAAPPEARQRRNDLRPRVVKAGRRRNEWHRDNALERESPRRRALFRFVATPERRAYNARGYHVARESFGCSTSKRPITPRPMLPSPVERTGQSGRSTSKKSRPRSTRPMPRACAHSSGICTKPISAACSRRWIRNRGPASSR